MCTDTLTMPRYRKHLCSIRTSSASAKSVCERYSSEITRFDEWTVILQKWRVNTEDRTDTNTIIQRRLNYRKLTPIDFWYSNCNGSILFPTPPVILATRDACTRVKLYCSRSIFLRRDPIANYFLSVAVYFQRVYSEILATCNASPI